MANRKTGKEETLRLKSSLHERLGKAGDHLTTKGEDCNVDLDFLTVRFLRGVVEDKGFRKKVRRELRKWDGEVRKSERASRRAKAKETPKEGQNGAAEA